MTAERAAVVSGVMEVSEVSVTEVSVTVGVPWTWLNALGSPGFAGFRLTWPPSTPSAPAAQ
jgi:hypothetical protein